ncbi:Mu transposase C-terminal domain-containing protein [Ktedonosporobacter rubrisoli]|uniref:Mu transposase C-terminal domain-containing protein n=1 Tax=Ktedonosporobacter rubrisoli TaxID=2509675 RepID=UPI001F5C6E89|nr:Mu transposase C-terminal domain-containing protein [Ktedonosporobacter rubrisoli]
MVRYDPADLAQIRIFYQDRFLCDAVSAELSGQTVSLKEIKKARAQRRKQVQVGLSSRQAVVEHFLAIHQEEPEPPLGVQKQPEVVGPSQLKGYINE